MEYEPDSPEKAKATLLKMMRVSVGIDLFLVLCNVALTIMWARQGGWGLLMVAFQAFFVGVFGRSFLDGLDEIERVKRIKLN